MKTLVPKSKNKKAFEVLSHRNPKSETRSFYLKTHVPKSRDKKGNPKSEMKKLSI